MDELHHKEDGHADFVLAGLNRFRQIDPKLCDFTLTAEDRRFPCHRSVLCLFSSFFRAAIQGGFRETSQHYAHLQVISSCFLSKIKEILLEIGFIEEMKTT